MTFVHSAFEKYEGTPLKIHLRYCWKPAIMGNPTEQKHGSTRSQITLDLVFTHELFSACVINQTLSWILRSWILDSLCCSLLSTISCASGAKAGLTFYHTAARLAQWEAKESKPHDCKFVLPLQFLRLLSPLQETYTIFHCWAWGNPDAILRPARGLQYYSYTKISRGGFSNMLKKQGAHIRSKQHTTIRSSRQNRWPWLSCLCTSEKLSPSSGWESDSTSPLRASLLRKFAHTPFKWPPQPLPRPVPWFEYHWSILYPWPASNLPKHCFGWGNR